MALDFNSLLWQVGPFALLIAVMYLMLIMPQRREEKRLSELRRELQIGDSVTTVGGIVGHIVSLKEDTVVIETAGERTRIRFIRSAIQKVDKLDVT